MTTDTLFLNIDAAWWQAIGGVAGAVGTVIAVFFSVRTATRSRRQAAVANARADDIEARLRREQATAEAHREAVRLAEQQATLVSVRREWLDRPGGADKPFEWGVVNRSSAAVVDVAISVRHVLSASNGDEGWQEFHHITGIGFGNNESGQSTAFRTQSNADRPEVRVTFTDRTGNRWLYDADDSLTLLNPRTIKIRTDL